MGDVGVDYTFRFECFVTSPIIADMDSTARTHLNARHTYNKGKHQVSIPQ